jgi:hypothetical protein
MSWKLTRRSSRGYWIGLIASVMVIGTVGCGGDARMYSVGVDAEEESEHDDPFHEHGHAVAAHRPASFVETPNALRRLHDEAVAELQDGDMKSAQAAIEKLNDIARWLPELAGDTDLDETAWNSVCEAGGSMEQRYRTALRALRENTPDGARESLSHAEEQFHVLDQAVEKLQAEDAS